MQKIYYFIRSLIRILKIEFLIINSSKLIPYLRRAIPQHTLYPKPSIRNVVRDQIKFSLNISDYMQWHVFTSEKDFSWRIAYKELLLATSNEYVIFDIGANIGAFSLKLSNIIEKNHRKNYTIHAFEPNNIIFNLFKNNISLNSQYKNNIILNELAIGDNIDYIDFICESENSGNSRIINKVYDKSPIQKVKQTTIDEYVSKYNIKNLNFIKIDVEGYEPFVLDGAIETIKRFSPSLYIEITPDWFRQRGRSATELIKTLKDFEYSIFLDMNNDKIEYQDTIEKILNQKQVNILAKK